jgi:tryptophan synthase alpha chain
MVSSSSTTGEKGTFSPDQISYFERIGRLGLNKPRLTGFGISDNSSFSTACKYSQGAIIGSAFVRILSVEKDITRGIKNFVSGILSGH